MIVRVKDVLDVLNIYVLKLLGPVVKINDSWTSYTANHSQDAPFCRKRMLKPHRCDSFGKLQYWTYEEFAHQVLPPPPKKNKTCHLKRNHFNRKIVFQPAFFRGYVSFSEEYQVVPPWFVIKIIAKTSSSSFAKSHSFVARWRLPTLRCQILRTFFFCEDSVVEHFGPLQQWRQNWMIWVPEIKCQKCQHLFLFPSRSQRRIFDMVRCLHDFDWLISFLVAGKLDVIYRCRWIRKFRCEPFHWLMFNVNPGKD